MEKTVYKFEDFLTSVEPEHKYFFTKIHESLIQENYKTKIESKAAGLFISYAHPKTKRSILNFLSRKNGKLVRIYVDSCDKHADLLNALPEKMEKEIAKSGVCKRLTDPTTCNPKCMMGYDFSINGNHYKKCRYSCFTFLVDDESIPVITAFVENEMTGRN